MFNKDIPQLPGILWGHYYANSAKQNSGSLGRRSFPWVLCQLLVREVRGGDPGDHGGGRGGRAGVGGGACFSQQSLHGQLRDTAGTLGDTVLQTSTQKLCASGSRVMRK